MAIFSYFSYKIKWENKVFYKKFQNKMLKKINNNRKISLLNKK